MNPGSPSPEVHSAVRAQLDSLSDDLLRISHEIHGDPELQYVEHRAAQRLRDLLATAGFAVTAPVAGMDTAFVAECRLGDGQGPRVGIFCEYDALQEFGHACGHNIIAAAGAGAAIAAARAMAGSATSGTVVVVGSPAEEGGGGKVRLIDAGVLAGLDVAMMVHPAGFDAVTAPSLGRISMEAVFTGKASHASAAPELGVNALDAATLLLVSIGLLRQQLRSDSRVHAIVLEGGTTVNVIPERAKVKLFARSGDFGYLNGHLLTAIQNCAAGAALATGTTVELTQVAATYDPVQSNPVLERLAEDAFRAVGRSSNADGVGAGSTDMGNVSRVVPALHAYVCVEPDLALHTREFEKAARSSGGDTAVMDGASILSTVVSDLLLDPRLVDEAKAAFHGTAPALVENA